MTAPVAAPRAADQSSDAIRDRFENSFALTNNRPPHARTRQTETASSRRPPRKPSIRASALALQPAWAITLD